MNKKKHAEAAQQPIYLGGGGVAGGGKAARGLVEKSTDSEAGSTPPPFTIQRVKSQGHQLKKNVGIQRACLQVCAHAQRGPASKLKKRTK